MPTNGRPNSLLLQLAHLDLQPLNKESVEQLTQMIFTVWILQLFIY